MANQRFRSIKTAAIIRDTPEPSNIIGKGNSELLYGEPFLAEKKENDFFYGTSEVDGYRGYVHENDLEPYSNGPTHFVAIKLSHLYESPDFKTYPHQPISFMSHLSLSKENKNGFIKTEDGQWIFAQHVQPIETLNNNKRKEVFLKTLHIFSGTPYLFGGRSALGIDCSGLVQVSCMYVGLSCPRDSDPQRKNLGAIVTNIDDITEGDLIFFKGHVAVALSKDTVINATARTMQVSIENLDKIVDNNGEILGIKRLEL